MDGLSKIYVVLVYEVGESHTRPHLGVGLEHVLEELVGDGLGLAAPPSRDIPAIFQQPHAPTPIAAVVRGPAAMRAELGELGASSGTAGLRIAVMTESRRREAPRSGAFEPNG